MASPKVGWSTIGMEPASAETRYSVKNEKHEPTWLKQLLPLGTEFTPESTSITVAQAAELWLERGRTEKLEQSTLRQYAGHVGLHIVPNLGSTKLARLTAPMVEAFKDKLLRETSRPMARKVLTTLKSILRDALRRGLVAQNAALGSRSKLRNESGRSWPLGGIFPRRRKSPPFLKRRAGAGGR